MCVLSPAVLAPRVLGLPRSSALAFWDLRIWDLEGVSRKHAVHKAVVTGDASTPALGSPDLPKCLMCSSIGLSCGAVMM